MIDAAQAGMLSINDTNLISWGSKKQPTVSRSSTEAEYKAIADATAELIWLQILLRELGIYSSRPATLWCDNIGATYPIFHRRLLRWIIILFVRELLLDNSKSESFLQQVADILTKALPMTTFNKFRSSLNLVSLHTD
jgi:hypothetical protein